MYGTYMVLVWVTHNLQTICYFLWPLLVCTDTAKLLLKGRTPLKSLRPGSTQVCHLCRLKP